MTVQSGPLEWGQITATSPGAGSVLPPSSLSSFTLINSTGILAISGMPNFVESAFADYQSKQPVNVLPNPLAAGAVVGTSGGSAGSLSGTLPTGAYFVNQGNLVAYVAAVGITSQGYPYWDINLSGTTSTTGMSIYLAGSGGPTVNAAPVTVAGYTENMALSFSAGSLTNISAVSLGLDTWNSAGTYVNTPIFSAITLTGTLTEFTEAGTPGATAAWGEPSIALTFSSGVAINVRIRIANPQLLLTSAATSYTSVFADRGTTKNINSLTSFTATVPSGVFAGGQFVAFRQTGAGTVSVVGDGTSVLVSSAGTFATRAQCSRIVATADMNVPNLFWVDGDLA